MSTRELPSGHRALRRGRVSELNRLYLVTTVTLARTPWFADSDVATAVAVRHAEPATFAGARILSWVLMPDHWHGLLELVEPGSLSRAINRFKSISANTTNRCLDRHGPVWARAFHDRALRRVDDIAKAHQYIVENPVRAGLCTRSDDYAYAGSVWGTA